MAYLVRVAGEEIQAAVRECSAGNRHYSGVSIAPVTLHREPNRPALLSLKKLLSKLVYNSEDESGEPAEANVTDFDSTRVNLLYEDEGDKFEVRLYDIIAEPRFDFLVNGERFSRVGRNILHNGKRLDKRTRLRDIFSRQGVLELTHLASSDVPDASLNKVSRKDFDVVYTWDDNQKQRYLRKAKEGLGQVLVDSDEILHDDSFGERTLVAAILKAVAGNGAGYEFTPVSCEDIQNSLEQGGYFCRCCFEDNPQDIEEILGALREKEVLTEFDTGYIIHPKHLKQPAVFDVKEVKDVLDLRLFLYLRDGEATFEDMMRELNLGLKREQARQKDKILKRRLEDLAAEGIVVEREGAYSLVQKNYEDPNQKTFSFYPRTK